MGRIAALAALAFVLLVPAPTRSDSRGIRITVRNSETGSAPAASQVDLYNASPNLDDLTIEME